MQDFCMCVCAHTHTHVYMPVCILMVMFTKARGDALLHCRLPCSLGRGSCQTWNLMFQLGRQPARTPAILLSFPLPSATSTGTHNHMVVCVCVLGIWTELFLPAQQPLLPLKSHLSSPKRFLCLGKVCKLSVVSQKCMRRKKFSYKDF